MKTKSRIIIAGMAGNVLEFYDFTLFGALSVVLSQKFFPSNDPVASLLAMLTTYAVGYMARPLGSIFLGHIGDRLGRKKALTVSIFMMAIPTFIIGLLPTYDSIGFFAPLILVICRLFQGICAGGEYNGSSIFLIEHNPERENLAGALASFSGTFGCLMGVLVGALAIQPFMPDWMWRVPFLMGLLLGFVGFYLRSKIEESPLFMETLAKNKTVRHPLWDVLKNHKRAVLSCFLGAAFSGTLGGTFIAYIPIYLHKIVLIPMEKSLFYNLFGMVCYIIFVPIAGLLADRYGGKRLMLIALLIVFSSSFPIFMMLNTGELPFILAGQALLCVFAGGFVAPLNVLMNKLFPTSVRYSGITLGYGLGMAAFGGAMPAISTFLIERTGYIYAPALYLMIFSLLGMLVPIMNRKMSKTGNME